MSKTFSSPGIILKRQNYGEADRIVTILTKDQGKIVAMAKGVRKTSSRKKGGLEPATISQCHFVIGKGMHLITQTDIIKGFSKARENLTHTTQAFQVLEIVDNLTAEGEVNPRVYDLLQESLELIEGNGSKRGELLEKIIAIIEAMGFGPPANFNEQDLKNYIEDLSSRKLKSKEFLTTTR